MRRHHLILIAIIVFVMALSAGTLWYNERAVRDNGASTPPISTEPDSALMADLKSLVVYHRKIVLLLADENTLPEAERQRATIVGNALFHDRLEREEAEGEVFGYDMPTKTLALTFDDGPHPQYTDEIVAILKQYGIPGTFFQVGRNLGSVDSKGEPKLTRSADYGRAIAKA